VHAILAPDAPEPIIIPGLMQLPLQGCLLPPLSWLRHCPSEAHISTPMLLLLPTVYLLARNILQALSATSIRCHGWRQHGLAKLHSVGA
jgi:hypothetical protein